MLLRKNDLPYLDKGRWYTFFIESNGSVRTLTRTDLEGAVIDSAYIKTPHDFHLVDVVYDINTVNQTNDTTMAITRKAFKDGRQAFSVPSATCFDYGYIYVFGYFGG